MNNNSALAAALLAALLGSAPVHGVNWRFMDFSPVRFFTDADWALFSLTGRQLVEETPDGETRTWENPYTGNKGAMQAVTTYKNDLGQKCRQVRIRNVSAQGLTGEATVHLCRHPKGNWEFSEPPEPAR